jgi:hypothetical protein
VQCGRAVYHESHDILHGVDVLAMYEGEYMFEYRDEIGID